MTLATRRGLGTSLGEVLSPLGFERVAELSFRCRTREAAGLLLFPCREGGGGFAFSCNVGVRFEQLERILASPDDDSEVVPTIVVPLHLLEPGRRFGEWHVVSQSDVGALRAEVLSAVQLVALPWIQDHGRTATVRERLSSKVPADWYALSPERRICLLAALDVIAGARESAIRRLDVALAERAGAAPRTRYLLEDVRRRIAGA